MTFNQRAICLHLLQEQIKTFPKGEIKEALSLFDLRCFSGRALQNFLLKTSAADFIQPEHTYQ